MLMIVGLETHLWRVWTPSIHRQTNEGNWRPCYPPQEWSANRDHFRSGTFNSCGGQINGRSLSHWLTFRFMSPPSEQLTIVWLTGLQGESSTQHCNYHSFAPQLQAEKSKGSTFQLNMIQSVKHGGDGIMVWSYFDGSARGSQALLEQWVLNRALEF